MLDSVLAAGELDAKGQSVHDPFPDDTLYFPAGHAIHVPPSGPEYPMLHTQSVIDVLPDWACEFGGHAEHVRPLRSVCMYMSALHLHALDAMLPVRERELIGHSEQLDWPGSAL
jgi:hypothetical protein